MTAAFVTVYVGWLLICAATEIRDRISGGAR